jgi:hypothetical protein
MRMPLSLVPASPPLSGRALDPQGVQAPGVPRATGTQSLSARARGDQQNEALGEGDSEPGSPRRSGVRTTPVSASWGIVTCGARGGRP